VEEPNHAQHTRRHNSVLHSFVRSSRDSHPIFWFRHPVFPVTGGEHACERPKAIRAHSGRDLQGAFAGGRGQAIRLPAI
jgi:hypothetical protein